MDAQQHYHSPQRTIPVPFPPVTHALLDEIVQRIRSVGNPQRVILFGSHARGDASSTSDIDILIIEDSTMPRYRRASHYLRALAGLYPAKDIVVWTPSEVDEWATVPQAFITTILREGRLLYDAAFWPDQATALEAIQIADHVRAVILALVPQALHPNNP